MTTTPALRRFLRYVSFDTRSSAKTGTHPSTPGQLALAAAVADELRALGARGVRTSPDGYVYAAVPASPGREAEPPLGLVAHLDTSDEASGAGVKPRVVRYAGGAIALGDSGVSLDPAAMPELSELAGRTLVVTDGTTLLGADDKAGLAIVVSAAEALLAPDAPPHRGLRIAFTPDEEIGEGPLGFDAEAFGAREAYTVDGCRLDEIGCATFNAARAVFTVRGVAVHTGTAKGRMVNAARIAAQIVASLPSGESPETTDGRQGFFHVCEIAGTVAEARVELLLRDFEADGLARRKAALEALARDLRARHGEGAVALEIRDQYRNMEDVLCGRPDLVRAARDAIAAEGFEPRLEAVRGGTDGATLSWRGIPCPNIGYGGRNAHGEREFLVVEEFEAALRVVLRLAAGAPPRPRGRESRRGRGRSVPRDRFPPTNCRRSGILLPKGPGGPARP